MSTEKKDLAATLGRFSVDEEMLRTYQGAIGKTIDALAMEKDELRFAFADGTKIRVFDDGQCCCETRHMTTDDDLEAFVGATLMKMEVRDGAEAEKDWGVHETQFLEVTTSKGAFTMVTHNEHNGYYGGFSVACKPLGA